MPVIMTLKKAELDKIIVVLVRLILLMASTATINILKIDIDIYAISAVNKKYFNIFLSCDLCARIIEK